jgi:ubiquinol-cytochrome c reductase cytochrome c subunit
VLVLLALIVAGAAYAALAPNRADAAQAGADQIEAGRELFLANCATCHGLSATGRDNAPSLVGVGAASVDFQVGTGRMPMAASGPQAPKAPKVQFSEEEIASLAAYVASLGPGPSVPSPEDLDLEGADAANGALIFRTNCAMCHNIAGSGGALTRGKYAPSLNGVSPQHMWEAMLTGPQSMPVFNDNTLPPESKQDIIAFLNGVQETPSPGGLKIGSLGPVPEGLVAWAVGLTLCIGVAVWLGSKSA